MVRHRLRLRMENTLGLFSIETDCGPLDRVIMASEVGVLPVDPSIVKEKGRLQPGRMFLIDFDEGRLIPDDEVKETMAAEKPEKQDWRLPNDGIGYKRILYIDDSPLNLKLVEDFLNARGDTVVATAMTAADGLAQFRTDRHDLYLIDINLPDHY